MKYGQDTFPESIDELSTSASENRPYGNDTAVGPGCVTDFHIRALAAFVAQLRDRVKELEREVAQLKGCE